MICLSQLRKYIATIRDLHLSKESYSLPKTRTNLEFSISDTKGLKYRTSFVKMTN